MSKKDSHPTPFRGYLELNLIKMKLELMRKKLELVRYKNQKFIEHHEKDR